MDNLQFDPMAFAENLNYMGIGLLGVFMIVGVIIIATYAVGSLSTRKKDEDKENGEN